METMTRQIIRLFFHCEQSQVYYGFKLSRGLPELAVPQLRSINSVLLLAAAVKLLSVQSMMLLLLMMTKESISYG